MYTRGDISAASPSTTALAEHARMWQTRQLNDRAGGIHLCGHAPILYNYEQNALPILCCVSRLPVQAKPDHLLTSERPLQWLHECPTIPSHLLLRHHHYQLFRQQNWRGSACWQLKCVSVLACARRGGRKGRTRKAMDSCFPMTRSANLLYKADVFD